MDNTGVKNPTRGGRESVVLKIHLRVGQVMKHWYKRIIVAAIVATLLLLTYDFLWEEGQRDLAGRHATSPARSVHGALHLSNVRYDLQSHAARAAMSLYLEAPDKEMEIKSIAFSPVSDHHRSWLLSFMHDCRMSLGSVKNTQGVQVSRASFDCDDLSLYTKVKRREIWYPFDSYEVALSPLSCINNSGGACTADDGGDSVSVDSLELRDVDQTFAASLLEDSSHGWCVTLARRVFVRIVSVIFLVLPIVFLAYIIVAGDPKDLLPKSLVFFATLWGLRILIVPPSVSVFPTLVDYCILSIFCILYLLVLFKLPLGRIEQ